MNPQTPVRFTLLLLGLVAPLGAALATASADPPRELGRVAWLRDDDRAAEQARAGMRPIFALFQEVPGCQTCVSFGENVLGHPLLIEAIETEFVPLAIYNNRPGADARALARYGEPAWNNPVVRFLDASGVDLIPRRAGIWTPHEIGVRMIESLSAAGRPVPAYLEDAVDELAPRRARTLTFAMHCFWSGEACLGRSQGLLASRAGFLGGREVVQLTYDPSRVSAEALLSLARRRGCADEVFARSDDEERQARAIFGENVTRTRDRFREAKDSDQKRALRGTPYASLELTERQALRVNAALAAGRSPSPYLSPRQRRGAEP